MPLGVVGNDDGIRVTRTKGGTNEVCTGKWIAQMGEKAHSALLNCSPTIVGLASDLAPSPDINSPELSGGCCRLRYAAGRGRAPNVAGLDLKGARSDASSPPCR